MSSKVIDGGDILVKVKGKATGHSTTCTVNLSAETKDRAFKKPESEVMGAASKFKNKSVSGLSCQITSDSLGFFGETESGYDVLAAAWAAAEPVEVEVIVRQGAGAAKTAFLKGKFVISSLQLTAPEGDDATYSITLDNDGPVTIDGEQFSDLIDA